MVDVLPLDPDILPSECVALGWCQGAYARDAQGRSVSSYSEWAVSVCLMGAIIRWHLARKNDMLYSEYVDRVFAHEPYATLWNDALGRTQAEVVELLEIVEGELGLRKVK